MFLLETSYWKLLLDVLIESLLLDVLLCLPKESLVKDSLAKKFEDRI